MDIKNELKEYAISIDKINTHCHKLNSKQVKDMNFLKVFNNSYASDDKIESAEQFFKRKRNKENHFHFLLKGIQRVHNIEEEFEESTFDLYNKKIIDDYEDENFSNKVFREIGNYKKTIIDAYWNPGEFSDYENMYTGTYRVGLFLYGYSLESENHNGWNPFKTYNLKPTNDILEYIDMMKKEIDIKINGGCVALKIATAYDRGIDFKKTSLEEAKKGFMNKDATKDDIKNFQDFIAYEICEYASKLKVPVQIHTGLGCITKTNACELTELIGSKPKTDFVLFHGSYPWTDDILALVYNFSNVHVDLCWLPIISMKKSYSFYDELLDVCDIEKIYWGCDTWTCEESIGALMAVIEVVTTVLANRVIENKIKISEAKKIILLMFKRKS